MERTHDRGLAVFKALSDASRLAVLRAIDAAPRCVEEIATALALAPSTVSHHLARLEQAGLARKSREQYYVVYAAEAGLLDLPLRSVLAAEQAGDAARRTAVRGASAQAAAPARAQAEADRAQERRIEEERRKVVAAFFHRGRLQRMPVQRRKKMIVLEVFAADFSAGRSYREADVDAIINRRWSDHCTIRRMLVDEGIMTRARGVYRMTRPAAGAATPDATTSHAHERTTPMTDRKAKILAWKMQPKTAGCFAITNTRNGRVYFGSTLNLHGPLNKHRFALEIGVHGCPEMQSDWNAHGPEAFTFEILETVPESTDPAFDVSAALEVLEKKWLAALDPYGPNGYNLLKKYREA